MGPGLRGHLGGAASGMPALSDVTTESAMSMASSRGTCMTLTAALAGRRIDAADSEKSRFPLANVSLVRDRLRELFIKRGVDTLVCSAACGADLVALEVAEHL